jgi:hypothetical protein
MGAPTSTAEGGSLRTLTYEYENTRFVADRIAFEFTFADDDSGMLIAKNVQALPKGEAEVRVRYAPQILPGMTTDDILSFMGDALTTSQSLSTAGELFTAHSYVGSLACVSAVFLSGSEACQWQEVICNDSEEEAATLYEEYILIGKSDGEGAALDSVTPEPEHTPGRQEVTTPRPTHRPRATATPKPNRTARPTSAPTLHIDIPPIQAYPFVKPTPEAPY